MVVGTYSNQFSCCCSLQVGTLTSRKSTSTPSLSDVMDSKASVASTDQASSAENLTSSIKAVSIHTTHTILTWFCFFFLSVHNLIF